MDNHQANNGLLLRFSTESYREGERTEAWREVFGRTVVRIHINPLAQESFRAEATVASSPRIGVIYASSSAAHQPNSRALIASDDLSFLAGASGCCAASQLGHDAELQPGDGVLMNNADLGSVTLHEDCRYTTFCVPRSAIAPLVPDIGALFARRVPAALPAMRLLLKYLALGQDGEWLANLEVAEVFATHVCDLLALALGATRDAAAQAGARGLRAARLETMKDEIRNSFGSPGFSINALAGRHRVSPRYVQKLFEASGSTFTQFVQEQRLTAACRALADPAQIATPVSTIAYDCGFNDVSNFNRAFRRHFGCTPTDIRMAARAQP